MAKHHADPRKATLPSAEGHNSAPHLYNGYAMASENAIANPAISDGGYQQQIGNMNMAPAIRANPHSSRRFTEVAMNGSRVAVAGRA